MDGGVYGPVSAGGGKTGGNRESRTLSGGAVSSRTLTGLSPSGSCIEIKEREWRKGVGGGGRGCENGVKWAEMGCVQGVVFVPEPSYFYFIYGTLPTSPVRLNLYFYGII